MAVGHALHIGHRCADYVVTRLVWRSGTQLSCVWCSAYRPNSQWNWWPCWTL